MRFPIGIQSFEKLIKAGYLYVDKTELIYKMVDTGNYYFLSRPRRFGKSLLVSTIEAYFKGKKELFKGLAMERLETDWTECPVFHLDLNTGKYESVQSLLDTLNEALTAWEQEYGAVEAERNVGLRFKGVVQRAYEKTGHRVAILVDEYDKPLLQNIGNNELQEELRGILRLFYSVLKTQDRYIKFGLLTGVSKFSKLSVFSDLNNLEDISLNRNWASLCGITEEELHSGLKPAVEEMAESNGLTYEETLDRLKEMYDGYHFDRDSIGVYNPFSLLNALKNKQFNDYWFETGTPSFLVEMLKRTNYELNHLAHEEQTSDMLNSIDSVHRNPVPLLYQSGYLTIKDYDREFRLYRLGFPNDEVRYGFLNFLLPFYTAVTDEERSFYIGKFVQELRTGNVDAFMHRFEAFFADFPYELNDQTERHYQVIIYLIFKLMGQFTQAEVHSSRGRADAVVKTPKFVYVFEFKLKGTAGQALQQIEEKGYTLPYAAEGRQVIKVGVEFSAEKRNVERWMVEEEK